MLFNWIPLITIITRMPVQTLNREDDSWGSLWIYLVATLLGGAVAALIYRFVNQDR